MAAPMPATMKPDAPPQLSLRRLMDGWQAVAVVKPRTVTETDYAVKGLEEFVGHDDGARMRGMTDALATP